MKYVSHSAFQNLNINSTNHKRSQSKPFVDRFP